MSGGSAATGTLLGNLVVFGRLLRSAGLTVGAGEIASLAEALRHVDLAQRREFRDAARAVLVGRRSEIATFDRLFDLFWRAADPRRQPLGQGRSPTLRPTGRTLLSSLAPSAEQRSGDGREIDEPSPSLRVYSPQEVLRQKDFAELTSEETVEVWRLMERLQFRVARRRSRRRTPAAKGGRIDPRRTLRRSLRFGGEPVRLARQQRKQSERPLVVLCDVSASMEIYSRLLLRFLWAAGRGARRYEAFLFGTRLTRVTRQLRRSRVDRALAASAEASADWGGGTRIGEALRDFNYRWGRRVLGQGAVVVLISDGWDTGEIELLGREMARLERSCSRLIWLNPLLGSEEYEPLTRGMQTALRHVDDFLPVHNLASLEQLAERLADLDRHPSGWNGARASRIL